MPAKSTFGAASVIPFTSSPPAYNIARSLRFNSADSAYLSRTFGTPTNNLKWSISFWMKRGLIDERVIFASGVAPSFIVDFDTSNKIRVHIAGTKYFETTPVYRDASAWYHFQLVFDSANVTQADRIILYMNGIRQVASVQSCPPSQTSGFNAAAAQSNLGFISGWYASAKDYFDGYLTEIYFIDGQTLTPSSFGYTDSATGVWMPKRYSGTYGTNGFYLNFSDNSSNTDTTIGKDYSGNSNNWTPYNLSTNTGAAASVAQSTGALPIYNTTDTYGYTTGNGLRTDAYSSYIVLAAPLTGVNSGTTFSDESARIKGSGTAKTITRSGNTITSTNKSKFYGSSTYFDGSYDYLTVVNNGDFTMGSSDFTVEFWANFNQANANCVSCGNYGNNNGWAIFLGGTEIYARLNSGGTPYTITCPINFNQWVHIAVTKQGNNVRLFRNGALAAGRNDVGTLTNPAQDLYIGYDPNNFAGSYMMDGFMQDLRIYKGVAKYTSDFSVTLSARDVRAAASCSITTDVPVNGGVDTGAGGEARGNFCTLNPLNKAPTIVSLARGNLNATQLSTADGNWNNFAATMGVKSGKWYWEVYRLAGSTGAIWGGEHQYGVMGSEPISTSNIIADNTAFSWPRFTSNSVGYYSNGSTSNSIIVDGSADAGATPPSSSQGDTIGLALDADNRNLTFYKNNSAFYTHFFAPNSVSAIFVPAFALAKVGEDIRCAVNFGQYPFAYAAPTGYKSWCTANIYSSVMKKPNVHMNVATYAGTGATQTISLSGGAPGLVWIKSRTDATSHYLQDVVRGNTATLSSNSTGKEDVVTNGVTSFDSNAFTLGTHGQMNKSGSGYVAWNWKAGSGTVSNTNGTITSQTSVNPAAGFSIVSYTGTGANATVGHGLGVVPKMVIVKGRDSSPDHWYVYHASVGATKYMRLNTTNAEASSSLTWNNTAPTSSVFSISTDSGVNQNTKLFIAYLFAEIEGYSKFGSYTGNGSSDGPFINCGFKPRWILVKASSAVSQWVVWDTSRNTYNPVSDVLYPNLGNAEGISTLDVDIVSNGFKFREAGGAGNDPAVVYIFAAFAESPFKYARAW